MKVNSEKKKVKKNFKKKETSQLKQTNKLLELRRISLESTELSVFLI
jgi:hypothetical protein